MKDYKKIAKIALVLIVSVLVVGATFAIDSIINKRANIEEVATDFTDKIEKINKHGINNENGLQGGINQIITFIIPIYNEKGEIVIPKGTIAYVNIDDYR